MYSLALIIFAIGTELSRNVSWMVLYKVTVFRSSRIFNMAAKAAAILNFISEQKNLKIVEDHPMNIHVQFGFNHICRMVATAGLNLTLDPMGKMFQNASSLKPLGY
jgi:hypothetical protein